MKRKTESDKKGQRPMKKRKEETNEGQEEGNGNDDEHIVFTLAHENKEPSKIMFDSSEEGQFFNFNNSDVNNSSEIDE